MPRTSPHKKKIEKKLFKFSGNATDDLRRYDDDIALQTLLLLNCKDIPRLQEIPPVGVSEIKFKSDCSNIKNLNFNEEIQMLIENDDTDKLNIKW